MTKLNELKDLVQSASDNLTRNVVLAQSEKDNGGWGQYLEEVDNGGTYGTSAGVRILSLLEPEGYSREIRMGREWLEYEWFDPESEANQKHDRAITYRHAAVLRALGVNNDNINPEEQEGFLALWEMRQNSKWPEYDYIQCYGDEYDRETKFTGQPHPLSTAMALLALLPCREYRVSDAFYESIKSLVNRVRGDTISYLISINHPRQRDRDRSIKGPYVLVETSLALLVLSRYRMRMSAQALDNEVREWIRDAIGMLRDRLGRILRFEEPDFTESHYHYFRPEDELRDSYIPFVTRPLMALAFLESCRHMNDLGRFWPTISNHVRGIIDEVSENGAYAPDPDRDPAIGDQVWVAELLQAIDEIDQQPSRFDLIRGKIANSSRSGYVLGGGSLILVVAAFYFAIINQTLTSSVLLFVAGILLTESQIPGYLLYRSRQFINRRV